MEFKKIQMIKKCVSSVLCFSVASISLLVNGTSVLAEEVQDSLNTETVQQPSEVTDTWPENYFKWDYNDEWEETVVKGFTSEGLEYHKQGNTDVVFPDRATEIKKWSFKVGNDFGSLSNLDVHITSISGKNITKIGDEAFMNEGANIDRREVFTGNRITSIDMPSLKEIGKKAFMNDFGKKFYAEYKSFEGNELSDLSNLPSLTTIGESAFQNSRNNMKETNAFYGNHFKSINNSLTIGSKAFKGQIVTLDTDPSMNVVLDLVDTNGNKPILEHASITNNENGTFTVNDKSNGNVVLNSICNEPINTDADIFANPSDDKISWYITVDVSGNGENVIDTEDARIFSDATLDHNEGFNSYTIHFENDDAQFYNAITTVTVNGVEFTKVESLNAYDTQFTVNENVLRIVSYDFDALNEVVIKADGYHDTVFNLEKNVDDKDVVEWLEEDFKWDGTKVLGFSDEGLAKHNQAHSDVVFPEKAEVIGERAFQNVNERKHHITSIDGKNIRVIEPRAFWNTIEETGLDSRTKGSFVGNTITSINNLQNLEEIGYEAFRNHSSSFELLTYSGNHIESIEGLPKLKVIGDKAFQNSVHGNDVLTTFEGNRVKVISNLPQLETIGVEAFGNVLAEIPRLEKFYGNNVQTIENLEGLQEIKKSAFYNYMKGNVVLDTAVFNNVQNVQDLPNLSKIGEMAFWNCINATGQQNEALVTFTGNEVKNVANMPKLETIATLAFANTLIELKEKKVYTLETFNGNQVKGLSDFESLKTIGDSAFANQVDFSLKLGTFNGNNLSYVTNMPSLIYIGKRCFANLFETDKVLVNIKANVVNDLSNLPELQKIDDEAFYNMFKYDHSNFIADAVGDARVKHIEGNQIAKVNGFSKLHYIGKKAFKNFVIGNYELESYKGNVVNELENLPALKTISDESFENEFENNHVIKTLNGNNVQSFETLGNVESIGFAAFENRVQMNHELIQFVGNNVQSLKGLDHLKQVHYHAFMNSCRTNAKIEEYIGNHLTDLHGIPSIEQIGHKAFINTWKDVENLTKYELNGIMNMDGLNKNVEFLEDSYGIQKAFDCQVIALEPEESMFVADIKDANNKRFELESNPNLEKVNDEGMYTFKDLSKIEDIVYYEQLPKEYDCVAGSNKQFSWVVMGVKTDKIDLEKEMQLKDVTVDVVDSKEFNRDELIEKSDLKVIAHYVHKFGKLPNKVVEIDQYDIDNNAFLSTSNGSSEVIEEHTITFDGKQYPFNVTFVMAQIPSGDFFEVKDGEEVVSSKATFFEDEQMTIGSTNKHTDFVGLYIDNVLVESKHYEVVEGSTVIVLSKEFTKSLGKGDHTVRILFTDARTDGVLNIKEKPNKVDPDDNGKPDKVDPDNGKPDQVDPSDDVELEVSDNDKGSSNSNVHQPTNTKQTTKTEGSKAYTTPSTGDNGLTAYIWLLVMSVVCVTFGAYQLKKH